MDAPTNLGLEPPPQPQLPPPPKHKKIRVIVGLFGIAAGFFIAFLRAWVSSYGIVDAAMLGAAIGGLLLPALIAYLIAGRKSVRNFARFGVWFSGLNVFFLILVHQPPVPLQQHIADLMKQAAGTQPVDNSGSRVDDTVRDIMREIFDERKAFDRDRARYAPELQKIYTVESFSSKEAMQHSIDTIRGAMAVDQQYSQQLENLPQQIQARVDRSGLPTSFANTFMQAIRDSYAGSKPLTMRRQTVEVERQWADTTVALYEFASANASQIRVDGSQLVIRNEKVRAEFSEQMKKSETLRDSFVALNAKSEDAQREVAQQMGVTQKELGLGDAGQPAKK